MGTEGVSNSESSHLYSAPSAAMEAVPEPVISGLTAKVSAWCVPQVSASEKPDEGHVIFG